MTTMNAAGPGRLLVDGDGSAAWNMAVDQAIAESISVPAESDLPIGATLRFYTWAEPTLSLGYFQFARDASPRFDQIARVRRSTGGGAILHHHELTYSLTVPTNPGEHGARNDLYRGVHAAFVATLDCFGATTRPYLLDKRHQGQSDPFLCFQRRTDEDLILCGYKVLGSAQRRVRGAIMQHGSLLLRSSPFADELPGIFDLTSMEVGVTPIVKEVTARIGTSLNLSFAEGRLTTAERERAGGLVEQRFAADQWWSRR
ncbi:MAG: hypothetical protein KDB00_24050 [Planctomycetales bacterium]|nr:hypothetical protein [Planctomycetales bacterium]